MRTPAKLVKLLLQFLVLAILVNTLAPVFLHMRRDAASPAGLIEICSADGFKAFRPISSDQPDHQLDPHADHCALCVTRVDPVTPSLSLPQLLLVTVGLAYLPPLLRQAPKSLFVWAASQARAPPAAI
ncbi:DUF2946 family protein [Janthinobacterium agaricidamnosum]|uniref:DUF2946 domain-containing protein n=1 Tax=Janthinobacterium agaricidamnosum NBRC 102515 = DSM 9628 TaxID=1349767 RepID=W0V498_9BURK|nr:DUF2946 family protein [Janthinobacterium agaricidamnosum]CDG83654.1 hypothetical protein GJA_3028 [Janthinobacterium agaricidamnosum NBRC 102515 = DSM 9628]